MVILGIESSASPASAAVMRDGKVLSSFFLNTGLTHSVTLMPLVMSAVEQAGITMRDVDVIAVTAGPGSFTGVRIGVSAAKGLADPLGIACLPVSTPQAIARPFAAAGNTVAACMDARRDQVYFGLFRSEDGRVIRMCEDCAVSLAEAEEIIGEKTSGTVILAGDGAEKAFEFFVRSSESRVRLAPCTDRYQSAAAVCACAYDHLTAGGRTVTAAELIPLYLRPAQAERMRQEKEAAKQ